MDLIYKLPDNARLDLAFDDILIQPGSIATTSIAHICPENFYEIAHELSVSLTTGSDVGARSVQIYHQRLDQIRTFNVFSTVGQGANSTLTYSFSTQFSTVVQSINGNQNIALPEIVMQPQERLVLSAALFQGTDVWVNYVLRILKIPTGPQVKRPQLFPTQDVIKAVAAL